MSSSLSNTNINGIIKKVTTTASQISNLAGSYGTFISNVANMSNNTIKLPSISSDSVVGKLLGGMNTATDIFSTITGNENGARVIMDNTNPQPAAFKWVEKESLPSQFISYDSVLIFAGKPLYADNTKGSKFIPIGFCENFNINLTNNVTTVQELRCEEQLVFPGKSQPINVTISRMCGKWSNLLNRLHSNTSDLQWNLSMQYSGYRDLFGLYCMVMDTSRQNIVTSFYLERCAITNIQFGISAGEMKVIESASIIAGRIIDPSHKVEVEEVVTTSNSNSETGLTATVNEGTVTLSDMSDDDNQYFAYTDANGTKHYLDGSTVYKNGDVRTADGTYYAADQEENYYNTKEYKDKVKASQQYTEAQSELTSATAKYESLKTKYSEAVNSNYEQTELVKIAKDMSKAYSKVESKKENLLNAEQNNTVKTQAFSSKVTEINKKNKVVELR